MYRGPTVVMNSLLHKEVICVPECCSAEANVPDGYSLVEPVLTVDRSDNYHDVAESSSISVDSRVGGYKSDSDELTGISIGSGEDESPVTRESAEKGPIALVDNLRSGKGCWHSCLPTNCMGSKIGWC